MAANPPALQATTQPDKNPSGALYIRHSFRDDKPFHISGGGSVGYRAARTSTGANVLVDRLCVMQPPGRCTTQCCRHNPEVPEMLLMNAGAPTFGFMTTRRARVAR
jgi:hypothetical protein